MGRCGSLDSLHDVTPSERPASHFSDEGNIIYLELTILKRKIQLCTERYFSRNTGVSFKANKKLLKFDKYLTAKETVQSFTEMYKYFQLQTFSSCLNQISMKCTYSLWMALLFYPNTFLEPSWKGWPSTRQDCSICSYLYFQRYLRLILSSFLFLY